MMWLIVIFLAVRVIQDYVLQPLLMSSGSIELPPYVVKAKQWFRPFLGRVRWIALTADLFEASMTNNSVAAD